MMRPRFIRRRRRSIAVALMLSTSIASMPTTATASDWMTRIKAKWHGHKGIPSAEALAAEIDCLEKHIDWYGSIVAKQPDVWGQARLMKYRAEFEKTLAGELGAFRETMQASISRTDQAFLAQALSLSAAVSGAPATMMPPSASTSAEVISRRKAALTAAGVKDPTPEQLGAGEDFSAIDPEENPAEGLLPDFSDTDVIQRRQFESKTNVGFGESVVIGLEPAERLDQLKRYVDHLHEIRRVNEGDDTADSPGYGLHLVRIPVSILPGSHTRHGFGAEITVTATPYLGRDLLPTTFRNLVINDLVKQITTPLTEFFSSPTSLDGFLALRKARQDGVKAVRAEPGQTVPVLGVQAKPTADDAAIARGAARPRPAIASPGAIRPAPTASNGGAPPAPRMAPPQQGRPGQVAANPLPPLPRPERAPRPTAPDRDVRLASRTIEDPPVLPDEPIDLSPKLTNPAPEPTNPALGSTDPALGSTATTPAAPPAAASFHDAYYRAAGASLLKSRAATAAAAAAATSSLDLSPKELWRKHDISEEAVQVPTDVTPYIGQQAVEQVKAQVEKSLASVGSRPSSVPGLRSRNARFAFPSTQMGEVYGSELILPVAFEAFNVHLRKPLENEDNPLLMLHHRVAGYVQDQVAAAYDLLARPECEGLWTVFATPELASAVRGRDAAALRDMRTSFLAALPGGGLEEDPDDGPKYTTTAAMAWAILVESVMLNERLIQDIGESASAKGAAPILPGDQAFFLPCPSEEARAAFNDYVRNRFPIHVFALDPVNQEQNIADQLSRSREMQFALSLAFVTGNISAGSMTRFARRLELQAETIALNRTQIAFSHGEDTFGWRFQPRYQLPPTQNNLVALRDTILGGPTREQDRRQLELEPGQRECVALVIMPSFVPYVTFETRTNWYRLNSPKHSEIDPVSFLKLSASIKRAYLLAQGICNAGLYRDGDIALLVNRVKQLAAELPMQSMIAQVPYENTNGGFELFNVGVTDLAPELRSWYGTPGISIDNGSSLFLVGDNFSVNQTNVVVGNKMLVGDEVNLLSRQVMQINVPAGAQTVLRNGLVSVEASIATPYGVSQSLYIPAVQVQAPEEAKKPEPAAPAPTFSWVPPTLALAYKAGPFAIAPALPGVGPNRRPADGLIIALDSRVDLASTLADLTIGFDGPDANVPRIVLEDVPYSREDGGFVITGPHYDRLISELFSDKRFGLLFSAQDPPRDVITSRTTIRLKGVPQADQQGNTILAPVIPADVSNKLTIKWFKAS